MQLGDGVQGATEMFSLPGRVALVIGGGGGIGGGAASTLAAAGAAVYVADVDLDAARTTAQSIVAAGGQSCALRVDLGDLESIRAMYAELDRRRQDADLDVMVNAAGVIHYAPILDQDDASLRQLVDVNVTGTFIALQEAARRMVPQGHGSIVNTASTAAFTATRLTAAAYAMTKGAVRQLTVGAAIELAGTGVRVNAVAPGTINTRFVQDTLATSEQIQAAGLKIPMGRIGTVQDLAGAILFLCSPASNYITGQVVVVDGGRLGRSG